MVVCWDILLCLGNLCIINERWKQTLERETVFARDKCEFNSGLRLVGDKKFAELCKV